MDKKYIEMLINASVKELEKVAEHLGVIYGILALSDTESDLENS